MWKLDQASMLQIRPLLSANELDKLAANYLAFIKLSSIRLWLRTFRS
jgi:transposase